MIRFNDIVDEVLKYNPDADVELLQKAYIFSAKAHKGQVRLSGEPYLIHPLETAYTLDEDEPRHPEHSLGSSPRHH